MNNYTIDLLHLKPGILKRFPPDWLIRNNDSYYISCCWS